MDPDTARLVAVIAASFTLLGGALTAGSGWLVAQANIRGQRELARMTARRERRERQVQGVLDVVNRRVPLYRELLEAARRGDVPRIQTAWERLLAETVFSDLAWSVAPGSPLYAAVENVHGADLILRSTFERLNREARLQAVAQAVGTTVALSPDVELEAELRGLMEAIAALNRAAEEYIEGE